jgi:ribosomal protein S18 acetylase RimI-like enzyme
MGKEADWGEVDNGALSYQLPPNDLWWLRLVGKARFRWLEEWDFVSGINPNIVYRPVTQREILRSDEKLKDYWQNRSYGMGFMIGAFSGEELIGFITALAVADDGDFPELNFKVVLPSWRGKGIGTDLTRAGMELMGKLGFKGTSGSVAGAFLLREKRVLGVPLGRSLRQITSEEMRGLRSNMVGGIDSLISSLNAGPIVVAEQQDPFWGISMVSLKDVSRYRTDIGFVKVGFRRPFDQSSNGGMLWAVECRTVEDVMRVAERVLEAKFMEGIY